MAGPFLLLTAVRRISCPELLAHFLIRTFTGHSILKSKEVYQLLPKLPSCTRKIVAPAVFAVRHCLAHLVLD